MAVQLTDDTYWINECYGSGGKHEHVSVYLIDYGGQFVIVDSGSFYHREEIEAEIRAITDGAGIDAILLSHSDYPHSANVSNFREEWGDVELVASSGSPEIQGLSDATKCEIGGSMEVLGRTFSFIDPPLADRSHTTWVYDHEDRVLYTADGFGNVHVPGECEYHSGEFAELPARKIYEYHRDNLVWLRYVDPSRLRAALDAIFEAYDVSFVAPVHGNPIRGEDLDEYLDVLERASERIAGEYTVG